MFEKVRQPGRARSILAYVIFGMIILVFVGFGMVPDQFGVQTGGVAAVVNRTPITLAQFRDRLQGMEKQFQDRAQGLPESQREQFNQMIRKRVLDDLVAYEVVYQAALNRGIRASDAEIRQTIWQIPAFQDEGQFRRSQYDMYLKSVRLSPGQFEDRVRRDLVLRKVQSVFQDALWPAPVEKVKTQRAEKTKIDLAVVSFSMEDLEKNLPVAPSMIRDFLKDEQNLARVRKVFDDNPQRFSTPEEVRVKHILIRTDPQKKDSDEQAKKRAEDLLARAQKEDFGKLAAEFSEDTFSKEKNGDLGFFSRGRMVPEFEQAAFAAETGKVVGPIRTDFGWHLIKVEDRHPAQTQTFDQVKDGIARELIAKTQKDSFLTEMETQLKAKNSKAVRDAIKNLKLTWVDTGEFSLDAMAIPKVGEEDRIVEAAVAQKGKRGLVPELIRSSGKFHVVDVKSLKEAAGSKTVKSKKIGKDGATDSEVSEQLAEFMASRKFIEAFNLWTRGEITKASVSRNEQLVVQ